MDGRKVSSPSLSPSGAPLSAVPESLGDIRTARRLLTRVRVGVEIAVGVKTADKLLSLIDLFTRIPYPASAQCYERCVNAFENAIHSSVSKRTMPFVAGPAVLFENKAGDTPEPCLNVVHC